VGLSSEFGIFDLGLLVELGGIYPYRGAGRRYSEIPKIGVLRGDRVNCSCSDSHFRSVIPCVGSPNSPVI
jgi:hypothetical protein